MKYAHYAPLTQEYCFLSGLSRRTLGHAHSRLAHIGLTSNPFKRPKGDGNRNSNGNRPVHPASGHKASAWPRRVARSVNNLLASLCSPSFR